MSKKAAGKNLEASIAPAMKEDDPIDNYETQGHLRTLMDAHGILTDPKKMEKVHKLAGRHADAIKGIKEVAQFKNKPSVDGLKAIANAKYGPKVSDTDNDKE